MRQSLSLAGVHRASAIVRLPVLCILGVAQAQEESQKVGRGKRIMIRPKKPKLLRMERLG